MILSIFDSGDESLLIDYIIECLRPDYQRPERVIQNAINEGLLYVDDITDIKTGTQVFLALTEWGEELWEELYEEE